MQFVSENRTEWLFHSFFPLLSLPSCTCKKKTFRIISHSGHADQWWKMQNQATSHAIPPWFQKLDTMIELSRSNVYMDGQNNNIIAYSIITVMFKITCMTRWHYMVISRDMVVVSFEKFTGNRKLPLFYTFLHKENVPMLESINEQ